MHIKLGAAAAVLSLCVGCSIDSAGAHPRDVGVASTNSVYRLIQEPDAGYQAITDMIAAATHSVRLAIYELADDTVVQALIDAGRRRHVAVKVLLDTAFHGRQTNQAAYTKLQRAGIDVAWTPSDIIYHEKVLVLDDTSAVVGTANLVRKYYRSSRDAFIVTTEPGDVAAITATFDADHATPSNARSAPSATHGDHLIWSPGARGRFVDQIRSATTSLDITSEELKDAAILTEIDHAARRGAACRIVLTEDPAWNQAINEVTAAGCSVHLLPKSADAAFMHEKLLLTDHASLIIGSHNLSTASLLDNRELSLRLDNSTAPDVLSAVASTFEHDYQQAVAAPNSEH